MNLLYTIYYTIVFFSSIISSVVLASTQSEVSLSLVEFDGYTGTYKGCKVNFEVFTGNDNQRDGIWCGQLKFSPPVSVGKLNARTEYDSLIRLEYIDSGRYNTSFGSALPLHTNPDDPDNPDNHFTYQPTKGLTEQDILKSNLVTWRLNLPISIQDVVDTVDGLKDSNGNFPKYKFVGYDWYNNVANCVTFSCRFLKSFGISINSCVEFDKWLNSTDKSGFFEGISYYSYYTLGFGWTHDNIQAQYAVQQINKNKGSVVWSKSGSTSPPPQFVKRTIKGAFGESFEAKIQ